jgi:NDP-sugar pyrophosphorylase family protein
MLPLSDGVPIIQHIINHCLYSHVDSLIEEPIIICLSEGMGENQIKKNVWPTDQFQYSISKRPMGTAGEVFNAKELLKGEEDFLVYYGDTISDVDIKKMYDFHKRHNFLATIAGVKGMRFDYGVINGHRTITSLQEKPILPYYICTGLFWVNKRIWKYLTPDTDFMKDVFPLALKKGEKLGIWKHKGFYYDVGNVSNYDYCLNNMK